MVSSANPYVLEVGDCVSLLKKLPPASVDLIVTSPPFDGIKEYKKRMTWEYFRQISPVLYSVMKEGGVVVWIAKDIADEKGSSFRQALSFISDGFILHDTMIHKTSFPLLSKVRYRQAFEYMFVLSKGAPKTINLLPEISKRKKDIRDKPIRDNVWAYTTGREITLSHLASFPLALALDHISSWSKEGDVVLDPFLRAGTTGVAAMMLNRKFIGFEKEKKYFTLAKKRIMDWETEALYIDEPCFSDDLYEDWDV